MPSRRFVLLSLPCSPPERARVESVARRQQLPLAEYLRLAINASLQRDGVEGVILRAPDTAAERAAEQRARRIKRQRARTARARAEGRCVRCRKAKEDPARSMCARCTEYELGRMRKRANLPPKLDLWADKSAPDEG